MKLNLGCGPNRLHGYVNIDARAEVNPDMIADIRGLGFAEGSIDEIYCSHTLEHFSFLEARVILQRFRSWLKPEGRLLLAVPDMTTICQRIGMGDDDLVLWNNLFGACDNAPYMIHRWGYTQKLLTELLEEMGFSVVGEFEGKDPDSRQDISLNLEAKKWS